MNRRHFLAAAGLTGGLAAAAGALIPRKNPYYSGPVSDHFDGTRFFAPNHPRDKTPLDIVKWQMSESAATWPQHAPGERDRPPPRVEGAAVRIALIGHASVLIQTHGVNLLVDPVWSERASPFTFAGPKRVNDPGVALADLPPLDAVLVSHNHYDHLDVATLSQLAGARPSRVLTPLGNDVIMRNHDPAIRAEAFDWGAKVEVGPGVFVHFEPSYHWSARGLFDRRMALWASFAIETPSGTIFHIADTALNDGGIYRDIRARHGELKLAILPIGAYEPRWFMRDQHVNPEESVRIFEILGARQALAHHWGTFQLTNEDIHEPPRALQAALDGRGLSREMFPALRPGEVFTL